MWAEFIHHLTLHFPIVLSLVLAAIGLYSLKSETPELRTILRVGGWFAVGLATVAVVSGILAAPGWFGQEGSEELAHHRNLGILTWTVAAIAACSYEWGIRSDLLRVRKLAVGLWCVVAFSVVGTGHWGGSEEHPDTVPWLESDDQAPDKANRD